MSQESLSPLEERLVQGLTKCIVFYATLARRLESILNKVSGTVITAVEQEIEVPLDPENPTEDFILPKD